MCLMSDLHKEKLILENFLPYRLSFLTGIISQKLASLYSRQYNLTPQEWKVMANLRHHADISAAGVGEKTALDKVAVSRAVRGLCDKELVDRTISDQDRRRSVLNLSERGREIYHHIEPLVIDYENHLLDILDDREKDALGQIMDKLTAHVKS